MVATGLWIFLLTATPFYRWWLTRPTPAGRERVHRLNVWCARRVILMGFRLRVTGLDHLPPGPCVVVVNHRSYLDIPLCHVALPRRFVIVGKAELARVPLFGWMYARQHIMLARERSASGARALVAADQALRQGDTVLIYPEGTTQHSAPVLAEFKAGAFMLAHRRGVAVVPLVLRGTREALPPDGRFLLQWGQLTAELLPPLNSTDFASPEALLAEAHRQMAQRLAQPA